MLAGPPYISDDPEPTDTGHWEIYHFGLGTRTFGVTAGQAGMDINYGAYKDLQLTAVIPADFEQGAVKGVGVGDIELAAKYRFLFERTSGYRNGPGQVWGVPVWEFARGTRTA